MTPSAKIDYYGVQAEVDGTGKWKITGTDGRTKEYLSFILRRLKSSAKNIKPSPGDGEAAAVYAETAVKILGTGARIIAVVYSSTPEDAVL